MLVVSAVSLHARAERPAYEPGAAVATLATARVRVHYVTTGADAVPGEDFVAEVARRADEALAAFEAAGFRAPLPDGDLGGDALLDVYLVDLELADGRFGVDTCTGPPRRCAGHLVIDNDFARFSYPSVSLAIQTLTSHELFHAVQHAYDGDEAIAWAEGTAVWAEEAVFPAQDDFERLVAHYLARPHRPFERDGAGFGDLYPYGAALWAYFLDARFGDGTVRAIWEACDGATFLDATEAVLAARGGSLAAAWIEHTRWNAETGAYAAPGRYPDAARLVEATREPVLAAPGRVTLSVEGMSARYLPVVTGEAARITVEAAEPVAVAVRGAAVAGTDDAVAAHHVLDVAAEELVEVVVTGVRRGAPPADVTVTVGSIPPDPGGCSAAPGDVGAGALVLLALLAPVRRRCGDAGDAASRTTPRARAGRRC